MTMDIKAIAERIHAQEFDHVFTLHADGTITHPSDVWAPEVYHDETDDVLVSGKGWRAMTGLTGQDGYHGAVMHPSEFIGGGVARAMLELAEDEPVTFALVVVTDLDTEEGDDDAVGWAITYRDD